METIISLNTKEPESLKIILNNKGEFLTNISLNQKKNSRNNIKSL